jgi:hypothetical protein
MGAKSSPTDLVADDLAARELVAHGGQLDEDDVAELVGGVGRDADGRDVAVDLHPLVLGGVLEAGLVGHARAFRE